MCRTEFQRIWAIGLLGFFAFAIGCTDFASDTTASKKVVPAHAMASDTQNASDKAASKPIMLSAASSTKEVVEELAQKFETNSGVRVQVNLGGSNSLATQIINGAPVDIFLSANIEWAEAVADAKLAARQSHLVTNDLVLAVLRGNPQAIHEPNDLLKDTVKFIALAGESVPAGKYAEAALRRMSLFTPLAESRRIVRGQDVRVALSYVERGEADAGVFYATDVLASEKAEAVYTFPSDPENEIIYVLTQVDGERHPRVTEFFEFLQSETAKEAFRRHGFRPLPGLSDSNHPADK